MKPQQVSVGEDELCVLVRAGNPTLLFLHGLAGHGDEWAPVIEHLSSEIGIIAPDQRAHGRSWVNGTRFVSRTAFVDDLILLVDRLAPEPVVVVGQSMGGVVAMLLADARPDLVSRLVMVEAGVAAMTEADLVGLKRWFDSWPESFADQAEAARFFGVEARSTPAWVEGLEQTGARLTRRFDPEAMVETMRVLALDSRWPEWKRMRVPTTLIRASESVLSDAEVAEMIKVKPGTELIVIEGSGHDVHLDRPDAVATVLGHRLRGGT